MMIQDNISIIVSKKKVHLQSMYRVEEIHNFFKHQWMIFVCPKKRNSQKNWKKEGKFNKCTCCVESSSLSGTFVDMTETVVF